MAGRKKRRPRYLRIGAALVLIGLLGYFCYMYINQEIVLDKQREQIRLMQEENIRLEEEYQKMLKNVEDKSTLEYIDKYMRSHFGMVQEGETRVDVVEEE